MKLTKHRKSVINKCFQALRALALVTLGLGVMTISACGDNKKTEEEPFIFNEQKAYNAENANRENLDVQLSSLSEAFRFWEMLPQNGKNLLEDLNNRDEDTIDRLLSGKSECFTLTDVSGTPENIVIDFELTRKKCAFNDGKTRLYLTGFVRLELEFDPSDFDFLEANFTTRDMMAKSKSYRVLINENIRAEKEDAHIAFRQQSNYKVQKYEVNDEEDEEVEERSPYVYNWLYDNRVNVLDASNSAKFILSGVNLNLGFERTRSDDVKVSKPEVININVKNKKPTGSGNRPPGTEVGLPIVTKCDYLEGNYIVEGKSDFRKQKLTTEKEELEINDKTVSFMKQRRERATCKSNDLHQVRQLLKFVKFRNDGLRDGPIITQ